MSLKIDSTRRFNGPNVYGQGPAMVVTLVGNLSPPREALLRARRVLERCLPSAISLASPGPGAIGFLEEACRVLQEACGAGVGTIAAAAPLAPRMDQAVVPFDDPEICGQAVRRVVALLRVAIAGDDEGEVAVEARLKELLAATRKRQMPLQDRALLAAAEARGIPVFRLARRVVVLGQGRYQQRISGTKTSLTGVFGNDLAANKDYSRRLLQAVGLPVPAFERVYGARQAVDSAGRIGYPVVVKPNNSGMGVGVSVGMRHPDEVREAYRLARQADRSVLVEEFVKGDDHRLLVVGGRFVAATRRIPAHVVGDGRSTVRELVDRMNSDPLRADGHRSPLKPLALDAGTERLLADQGRGAEAVPDAGERVFLRRNANLSTGGTPHDVTDAVHPHNRDIAERAALAIGLDVAGIDILTTDIGVSMWENGGRICEVNSRPGIHMHLWPEEGLARDVTAPILDMLFPPGRPVSMPVVGVFGDERAELVAKLLVEVLSRVGLRVGYADRRGVLSAGRRVGLDPMPPSRAIRALLLDPVLEVGVVALRAEEVLDEGLDRNPFNLLLLPEEAVGSGGGPSRGGEGYRVACEVVVAATRGDVLAERSGQYLPEQVISRARCMDRVGREEVPEGALEGLREVGSTLGYQGDTPELGLLVLVAAACLGLDVAAGAGTRPDARQGAEGAHARSAGRTVMA